MINLTSLTTQLIVFLVIALNALPARASEECSVLFSPTASKEASKTASTFNEISPRVFFDHHTDHGTIYVGTSIATALEVLKVRHFSETTSTRLLVDQDYGVVLSNAFRSNGENTAIIPLRFKFPILLKIARVNSETELEAITTDFDIVVSPNRIAILNQNVLLLPTERDILADLDRRLLQTYTSASTVILLDYEKLWNAVPASERSHLTDPEKFLRFRRL